MRTISVFDFKKLIREERVNYFKKSSDVVYGSFVRLGFDKGEKGDFINEASFIIEALRKECGKEFRSMESNFNSYMIRKLIPEKGIGDIPSFELIVSFCECFFEHIYALNLSNTQSRRSRAGMEFENMVGLLLMGCQIPFISGGSVSKNGLNKSLDLIIPNVESYSLERKNTILISLKTTLRERGQEVLEDVKLLDKKEVFLLTLDEEISSEVFSKLDYFGIKMVTTKSIKKNFYNSDPKVLSLEELIFKCLEASHYGKSCKYSDSQKESLSRALNKEISKNREKPFVVKYLEDKLDELLKS